jgi:hypothetical protein
VIARVTAAVATTLRAAALAITRVIAPVTIATTL